MGAYIEHNCSGYSERPVRDTILFTFLITWGTGMILVLSTHANLVNGARPAQHPIPISTPLAIILMVIGAYTPGSVTTAKGRLLFPCPFADPRTFFQGIAGPTPVHPCRRRSPVLA